MAVSAAGAADIAKVAVNTTNTSAVVVRNRTVRDLFGASEEEESVEGEDAVVLFAETDSNLLPLALINLNAGL